MWHRNPPKRNTLWAGAMCVALGCCLVAASNGASPSDGRKEAAAGALRLEILVLLDKPRATLLFRATNVSKEPVEVEAFRHPTNYALVITPGGREVPCILYGDSFGEPVRKTSVTLQPGERKEWDYPFGDPGSSFSELGTYRLCWKINGQTSDEILLCRTASVFNKWKVSYAFEQWGGKTKLAGLVPALKFDAQTFANLGAATVIHVNTRQFGATIRRDAETPVLEVSIIRLESALAVHEAIIRDLSGEVEPPPTYQRQTAAELAQVGDVCFVPIRKWVPKGTDKPVHRRLLFARNNIYVTLGQWEEGKKTYWDLGAVAGQIDKLLLDWLSKPKGVGGEANTKDMGARSRPKPDPKGTPSPVAN